MDPNIKRKSGDSFCALAWMHTSSEPYGTCRSCCIARDHITREDGKIYSLAEYTVSDIINSTYMKKLRTAMRNGGKPKQCKTCWDDEANGKESKRLIYNKMVEHVNMEIDYDAEVCIPRDLQINIGNVCNLKCRTCSPVCSSKWAVEYRDRGKDIWKPDFDTEFNDFENSVFWHDIDNWSKTVERLEIMGGEPFYSKSFKKLVDALIDNGSSKHISMNLSTNGTIFNSKMMDRMLRNFKRVGINLSIDGIGKHFDYIRHGVPWETVKSNLDSFFHLYMNQLEYKQNKNDGFKLSMSYTITIGNLNIFYLKDIHEFFHKNYIQYTGVQDEFFNRIPFLEIWNNVVHFTSFYSANVVPDEVKGKILRRVTRPQEYGMDAWDRDTYVNDITPILNHAKKGCKNDDWLAFVRETMETDRYRKENFEETFPELFELLKPYWEKAKSEFINEESKIFKLDTIIRNKGTNNDS